MNEISLICSASYRGKPLCTSEAFYLNKAAGRLKLTTLRSPSQNLFRKLEKNIRDNARLKKEQLVEMVGVSVTISDSVGGYIIGRFQINMFI